jgi:hypothetical protein
MKIKTFFGKIFFCLLLVLICSNSQAFAADPLPPGVSRYDNGVKYPGNPAGDLTTCSSVWKTGGNGKSISGGQAGLDAGGDVCFSGGGQNFCATMNSSLYTCANVNLIEQEGLDIAWTDFDIGEDKPEEVQKSHYTLTTRDSTRGRAGHEMPLFMNAHGVCRKIDNTAKKEPAVFMGVRTAEEWRTVHGVPEGSDPNGGYNIYANEKKPNEEEPEKGGPIKVGFAVCCAPVLVEICGSSFQTSYGTVGDIMQVWGGGGHATIQCFANNDWRVIGIDGICGGGEGGGDGENRGGDGYYNPNSGGEMTAQEFNSLDSGTREALREQGYRSIEEGARPGDKTIKEPPEKVEATNKQAKDDAKTAKEAAEKKAEEEKKKNEEELARKEAEAKAAEEAARDAEEEDDEER